VNGRIPPELIQKVVRANFAEMRRCYEAGLARTPTLRGKITTKFVIARDGTVSSADDVHDTTPLAMEFPPEFQLPDPASEPRFPDPAVVACVVARFKALTFPEPEGGIVTVVYPIIFAPGD
jgi:hypothetical protein